ncbi:site-specific integrase [Marinifilum flexuosum]|uniref:site-specific integrase n=1 Tax=Marinifilum flexuosum TaxID=1117708 RepID=UPI002490C0D0|nr:site-specific integrase [Marinifilum flexuosum]
MIEKLAFKLKEPQIGVSPSQQKETLIYLLYNFGHFKMTAHGKRYLPLKYSTGLKVKPHLWHGKPSYKVRQSTLIDHVYLNKELTKIEEIARNKFKELKSSGELPTPDLLRKLISEERGKLIEPQYKLEFNEYITQFIDDIENGKRFTDKGEKYKPLTVKNYKGFKVQIKLFQKETKKRLGFEDINMEFYDRFVNFLTAKEYSPNTVGRHVKHLKSIMNAAKEEGLHTNIDFKRKKFKVLKVDVQDVYLNDGEIKKLEELDLSEFPKLDIARDVFLVGCYTAQRYSDYSTIMKADITEVDGGRKILTIIQRKTGEIAIVPVRSSLDRILKKYDYTLPKTYEQKLNSRIKDVAKMAKIKERVVIEKIRGGQKIRESKKKHDLIKTHTARRSGATNLYLAGIPTIDIMKITGHKTEREFLRYIKVTKEETAQNLLEHPYFN